MTDTIQEGPGALDPANTDMLLYTLLVPEEQVANVKEAASLLHMMNANTFTCGAYHLSDDVSAADVASSLRDNIMNRQWMCGFPDKLVVASMGQYVVSVYGNEELVNTFRDKLKGSYPSVTVLYDENLDA